MIKNDDDQSVISLFCDPKYRWLLFIILFPVILMPNLSFPYSVIKNVMVDHSAISIFCGHKCHWRPLCYFHILWSQMSLVTTLLFLYSVVSNVIDDHSAISIFCDHKCHWWPLCYFYILRSQMSLMTTLLFLYSVVHPSPFMGLKFRPFLGLEIVPETKQWAVDRPGNR